jgi:hypothetical protein
MPGAPWYYAVPGTRHGPFTTEELARTLLTLEDPHRVLVWRAGLETWTPAGSIDALRPHLTPREAAAPTPGGPVDTGELLAPDTAESHWFVVGPLKLVVMGTVTFGIYELYWLYQHWRRVEERENIHALLRTLFAVVWCHALFRRIWESAETHGVRPPVPAGILSAAFILLTILARLPDPYWLVTFLAVWPLAHVQVVANAVSAQLTPSSLDRNTRLTGLNWVAVVLGGVCWVLAVVGVSLSTE